MNRNDKIGDIYAMPIISQLSRLLTQIDRNPHSPTYGSCCRNFWHYRIEDISNSQFQELVLTLALTYRYNAESNLYYKSERLLQWIHAVILFWAKLQRKSGSFDEVYQGQDSYAATAFTAFAISESILQLREELDKEIIEISLPVLTKAAKWLIKTSESFAVNQMSGAAAALQNIATLTGERGHSEQGNEIIEDIEKAQCEEGWFNEYGGADIGYDSLTQSYLSLIYMRSGNELCKKMAIRSISFLKNFIHADGTVGGEYGSRNTEYFIPLGVALLANESEEARDINNYLLYNISAGRHNIITKGLDDRYFAYLSPYYMLAAHFMSGRMMTDIKPPALKEHNTYFSKCHLWSVKTKCYRFISNLRKGGIFHCEFDDKVYFDEGLFGRTESGRLFISQQLNDRAIISVNRKEATVKTGIFILRPIVISPWKNILVKMFNLIAPALLRRKFLDFLRKRAVSSNKHVGNLERRFVLNEDSIEVGDVIRFNVPIAFGEIQLAKERVFSFASTGFFQLQEISSNAKKAYKFSAAAGKQIVINRIATKNGIEFFDGHTKIKKDE